MRFKVKTFAGQYQLFELDAVTPLALPSDLARSNPFGLMLELNALPIELTTPAALRRVQVDRLKKDWLRDPCYDIDDLEGFDDVRDELAAFAREKRAEWEMAHIEQMKALGKQWGVTTEQAEKILALQTRASASKTQAVSLLTHYFRLAGVITHADNATEVGMIVDCIVDTVQASITADMLKEVAA